MVGQSGLGVDRDPQRPGAGVAVTRATRTDANRRMRGLTVRKTPVTGRGFGHDPAAGDHGTDRGLLDARDQLDRGGDHVIEGGVGVVLLVQRPGQPAGGDREVVPPGEPAADPTGTRPGGWAIGSLSGTAHPLSARERPQLSAVSARWSASALSAFADSCRSVLPAISPSFCSAWAWALSPPAWTFYACSRTRSSAVSLVLMDASSTVDQAGSR